MSENTEALVDNQTLIAVLNEAMSRGADFAEIFVEESTSSSVSYDDGKIDSLSSSSDLGAGIRVVYGDTTGFAHSSDLSLEALTEAASTASKVTKSSNPAKAVTSLKFVEAMPNKVEVDPSSVAKETKIKLLESADAAARSAGPEIVQVSARVANRSRKILIANSDGHGATDTQIKTLFSISTTASGDTGLQTGQESIGHTSGFEVFDRYDVTELATTAAQRALRKLDAKPAPAGTWPVVIGPGSGGVLFHEACGHGLEADLVHKGASVFADRVGTQVASEAVTLIDDGTMTGEWGTYGVDDEGHKGQKNVLIKDGVLIDYLWDAKTARKHDRGPSGSGRRQSYKHLPMTRMTNTYLAPGQATPDEIIASVEYGVYVAKLGGGQVDTASGDFVFGMVESYLIENGELTVPLRDGQLIGNGPKVLSMIEAVGNDFEMGPPGTCGKDGQGVPVGDGVPTLKVTELTVGGAA